MALSLSSTHVNLRDIRCFPCIQVYANLKELQKDGTIAEDAAEVMGSFTDFTEGNNKAVVEFTASQSAVLERDQRVRVGIKRYGKLNCRVIFRSVVLFEAIGTV